MDDLMIIISRLMNQGHLVWYKEWLDTKMLAFLFITPLLSWTHIHSGQENQTLVNSGALDFISL